MSTYPAIVLKCEGATCLREMKAPRSTSADELLNDAAMLGWGQRFGSDYCPECMHDKERRTGEKRKTPPAYQAGRPTPGRHETTMTNETLIFDATKASTYHKTTETICHLSDGPIRYDKSSSWGPGSFQEIDGPGWVMIELTEGKPNGNVYGCEFNAFKETYIPSPSGRPYHYIKTATVEAYQPGHAFKVKTMVKGKEETSASARASARAVKNPGGEVYPVSDDVFRASYVPVT